jgi:UV DNA damage endonuclease
MHADRRRRASWVRSRICVHRRLSAVPLALRIGYPCINRAIGCTSGRTFRLASYSESRLIETVGQNLDCLGRVLTWNAEHSIGFFRITSDLVPFASHSVCTFDWARHFRGRFRALGRFVMKHKMRISMHPDQFVLLNALDERIVESSVRELSYHTRVLDLMGLPPSAKLQIHIGGVYGDKPAGIGRFVERYRRLPEPVRKRLVVENDDRCYTVADCLEVNRLTGVPVLFDVFHHRVNSSGQSVRKAMSVCAATWRRSDGLPMVDYSSQEPGRRSGRHAERIDIRGFRQFLAQARGIDCDVMLEIKDKERSALEALRIAGRTLARAGRCRSGGSAA